MNMEINYLRIGRQIRDIRRRQKMTQEKLAELSNTGVTHISHIETGNTIPSLKTFIAILNALGASADEVLRGYCIKANHMLNGELAEIMADCKTHEFMVIVDTAKALKDGLYNLRGKKN